MAFQGPDEQMKRADARIDAYIAKSADFAKPILRHLRELVREACPESEETMKWSCPAFMYGGRIMCGMAAFKEHCTFGFWHQGMSAVLGKDAANADNAMGSFGRVKSLDDLPSDKALLRYIRKAAELNESDAPARPRPVRSAAPPAVPDDLAAGLKKSRAAGATFEKLSPSHRREYVEWITEAKRDETRQKRLATTIEWLADGKSRNWKYEKC
jgi:uncharacterized protein YdeI (YjbR/CyaY-like superfamily)